MSVRSKSLIALMEKLLLISLDSNGLKILFLKKLQNYLSLVLGY